MSFLTNDRLGINAVVDRKVELRRNWTEDDLQQVLRAAYEHIFGRERVYTKGVFSSPEALLRNGNLSVRDFVRALAQSDFYKEKFFHSNSQVRFIELNYKHLLGRAPYDQSEIAYHVDLYASQGYEAEINSYIDSQEYSDAFGDNTVPYYRGFQSLTGMKTVGFTRLFSLYRGNGNSDNAQGVKNARLQEQVALGLSNAVLPPSKPGGTSALTAKRLGTTASGQADNRVYLVEVVAGGVGTKVAVRRSRQVYTVTFDQLSNTYQSVHRRGDRIVSVTPL
jgi:phycoerythrocyanin-associated rod linker protein